MFERALKRFFGIAAVVLIAVAVFLNGSNCSGGR
jgi:hypothetical protein